MIGPPESRRRPGTIGSTHSGAATSFDLTATATECEVSGDAGIPDLFCTPTGARGRYQVVFWNDSVDVFDLARHGEPMVPTFSVPARLEKR